MLLTRNNIVANVIDMKRIELAKQLETSRQHVDYVLRGKRNLVLWRARIAVALIGGTIETWMDSTRAKERLVLFDTQDRRS